MSVDSERSPGGSGSPTVVVGSPHQETVAVPPWQSDWSVCYFYPLFSCEEIPFVFAKHVMEMIVTVVMLYIIIIKLKMSDLMTKMYKSSMISN